jgi:hypothetical protein
VISTIPMPDLLAAVGYDRAIDFRYRHGWVITARVNDADAFASLLIPHPYISFYRASLTGDQLSVETLVEPRRPDVLAEEAAELLGVRIARASVVVVEQRYAKILPIDNDERRRVIHEVSTRRGIAYQLGRFATWRPGLMTEDLLKDIRLIEGWIRDGEGGPYAQELHEAEKRRAAVAS